MRVHDLGTMTVDVAGRTHSLGATRLAALLGTLCAEVNRRVSTDQLVEGVWGIGSAASTSSVESLVWRLRKLLEPRRGARHASTVIVNDAGGFRLALTSEELDSLDFVRLAGKVRVQVEEGRPEEALATTERAMSLWRGRPYESVGALPSVEAATARLEEVRAQLLQRRVDALLAVGDLDRALAESGDLVREFPLREPLWVQRMTVFARAGRTEEALTTYTTARSGLLDEAGVEPGPELRDLQRRVLLEDPSLRSAAPRARAPVAGRRPVNFPDRTTTLVGRDEDVDAVSDLLGHHRLVTLVGAGGCGKTRLAVELGAMALGYPDGVFFVDLNALTGANMLVDAITSTIGLEVSTDDDALATLIEFARSRRMLIVLDNCEHLLDPVAAVTAPLVAEGSSSVVLATSREPLGVPGEQIWALPPLSVVTATGGVRTSLGSAATQLFLQRAKAAAPRLDLAADQLDTVDAICRALDGLPLAIELAAARTRSFAVAEILEQVTEDPGRLALLGRGPNDHRRTVRATIDWSHRLLPPAEQLVHRRLSVLPGQFTRSAARAVTVGSGLSAADVDDLLAMLVHRSMLSTEAPSGPGRPTTYAQLATVRAHAAGCLDEAAEVGSTTAERDAWVADLLSARPRLGRPEEAAWLDSVEDDYSVVRTSLTGRGDAAALRHLAGLLHFWYYRGRIVEGRRALEDALRLSADPASPEAELARIARVGALFLCGRVSEGTAASEELAPQLVTTEELRPEVVEALIGAVRAAWSISGWSVVTRLHRRLELVVEGLGNDSLALITEASGAVALLADSDLARAASHAEQVYDRARGTANLEAQWTTAGVRHIVALVEADPDRGLVWVDRLIRAHLPLGSGGTGVFLEGLANFTAMQRRPHEALSLYAASQAQTARVGMAWPSQTFSVDLLEQARAAVAGTDRDRAWRDGLPLTILDVAAKRGLLA